MGYEYSPLPSTPAGYLKYTPVSPPDPNAILFETPARFDACFYAKAAVVSSMLIGAIIVMIGLSVWLPEPGPIVGSVLCIPIPIAIFVALLAIIPRRFTVHSDRLVIHTSFGIKKNLDYAGIISVETLQDGLCSGLFLCGIKLRTALSGRLRIVKRNSWDIYIAAKDSEGLLQAIRTAMYPGHALAIVAQGMITASPVTAQPGIAYV